MLVFSLVAAALVAVALAFLLPPLLRRAPAPAVTDEAVNVAIYRDQLAELEADVQRGVISPDQLAQARAEIERRLAEDLQQAQRPRGAPGAARTIAIAVALVIPAIAVGLYAWLGNTAALDPEKRLGMTEEQAANQRKMEEILAKLAARTQAKPEDPVAWAMLGRAYGMTGRLEDSVKAFQKSVALKSDDPGVLVDYAEVLALALEGRIDGEPARLAQRALSLDPANEKALALLGTAAYERREFAKAVGYWEKLLARAPPGSEYAQAIAGGIAKARAQMGEAGVPAAGKGEAKAPAAAPGPGVAGTVTLAPALRAQAGEDDTVFVFARAEQGPRMPLAVQRFRVKDLPAKFALDDSMAMAPGMKLSGFERVVVSARVSRSGSAMPQSGDLEGSAGVVKPGARGLTLTIDRKTP